MHHSKWSRKTGKEVGNNIRKDTRPDSTVSEDDEEFEGLIERGQLEAVTRSAQPLCKDPGLSVMRVDWDVLGELTSLLGLEEEEREEDEAPDGLGRLREVASLQIVDEEERGADEEAQGLVASGFGPTALEE